MIADLAHWHYLITPRSPEHNSEMQFSDIYSKARTWISKLLHAYLEMYRIPLRKLQGPIFFLE